MDFWLGTHEPYWIGRQDIAVPLFVSFRRLLKLRRPPVAVAPWALDSGGFTELEKHGRWVTSPEAYLETIHMADETIGGLTWAAPQDWMCEAWITARTGLSVREHQERTVASYLDLRDRSPVWIIPVLQGGTPEEYIACAQLYEDAGVRLDVEPVVGLGSVCRRQATKEIGALVREFFNRGIRLHGFGVKKQGLAAYGHLLTSADSLAWSVGARHREPLPECSHKRCNNCARFALRWRAEVLAGLTPQGAA